MVSLRFGFVLPALLCVDAAVPSQQVPVPVRERFDLADAAVGGDGSLPGTGPAAALTPRPPRGGFVPVGHAVVDGVFGPSATGVTRISSTGLQFDFSSALGIDDVNSAPANGPAGTVNDPSRVAGRPDYARDPNHSLLEMHACLGITYDLAAVRALFGDGVAIERFTTVAGAVTPATTNFWLLVDGEQRAHGSIEGSGERPIDVELQPADRFLTLVVGDGGAGTINFAHAYFGDPFLTLRGAAPTSAPSTVRPADGATGVPPWLPLGWHRQLGSAGYDVTLWRSDLDEPAAPTARVRVPRFQPSRQLAPSTTYRWRLATVLPDGRMLRGPTRAFTTQEEGGRIAAPPFDLSPSAQTARERLYAVAGIDALCAPDTPLRDGMRIALFGDSITDVSRYQQPMIAAVAERRARVEFLNRGINGGKAEDLVLGVRRYGAGGGLEDPLPFAEQLAADRPAVAVVYVGVNESNDYPAARGLPASPPTSDADYRQHLVTMVRAAQRRGVAVVLATPSVHGEKPDGSNPHDARLDQLAAITRGVAAAEGATLVDLRAAFLAWLQNHNVHVGSDGQVTFPSTRGLLTGDGVHPNQQGGQLTAELIADGIRRALQKKG